MRILVTGATGFLGRAFCEAAVRKGLEIAWLDRGGDGTGELDVEAIRIEGSLDSVPWREVRDFRPDALVHFAWIATPGVYLDSRENRWWQEVTGDLFRDAAEAGIPHLVGIGSCAEYLPSDAPLSEGTSELGGDSEYVRAKIATGTSMFDEAVTGSVACSWLRVFYPYGRGEHPNRLPSLALRKLASGHPMELRTPRSVRDYIHVDDVTSAVLRVLEEGLTGAVNIGSGRGVEIREIVELLADSIGFPGDSWCETEDPGEDPNPFVVAETNRLRTTGWEPAVSLERGLSDLARHCQD